MAQILPSNNSATQKYNEFRHLLIREIASATRINAPKPGRTTSIRRIEKTVLDKKNGAQGRSRTTDTTIFSRLLYH